MYTYGIKSLALVAEIFFLPVPAERERRITKCSGMPNNATKLPRVFRAQQQVNVFTSGRNCP